MLDRSKRESSLRFDSVDGISPLKWLFDISKRVSCVRLPTDAGTDPVKLHPFNTNCLKNFRLPIDFGNSPEKAVLDKSKNLRGLLQFDNGKSPLSSELSSRFSSRRFGSRKMLSGNLPRNSQLLRERDIKEEERFMKEVSETEDMSLRSR